MNKQGFLNELEKQTGYDMEKCIVINNIIEDVGIIGKSNKEKMIERFKQQLNLDDAKAEELYETAMGIISGAIKDKIKHPFKSQD